jgi:ATP-dependent protease ClpP protease subunit
LKQIYYCAVESKKSMSKILNSSSHYKVRNDGTVDMFIWDDIDDFWGINKNSVRQELLSADPDEINLHISGMGGDVANAIAIKNLLKGHKAKVIAWLEGFVASAHTIVMQAADEINMSDDAMVLIHNVEGISIGNKDAHRQQADTQELVDNILVNGYVKKTGKTRDEIVAQMKKGDKGQWLNAQEAEEFGLVDNVVEEVKFAADINFSKSYFSNHKLPFPKTQTMNKKLANFLNAKINKQVDKGTSRKTLVNKLTEELGIEKSEVESILSGETEPSRDDKEVIADVLKFRASEFKTLKASVVDPGDEDEDDENFKGVVKTFKNMFSDFANNIGEQIKTALKNKKDEEGNAIEVNIDFGGAVEKATEKFTNEVREKGSKKVELNNEALTEMNERLDTLEDENKELKRKLKNTAQRPSGKGSLGNKNAFNYDRNEDPEDDDPEAERNDKGLTKALSNHFAGD